MIYIVILLVIILVIVSFRHFYLKREISRTTKILSSVNRHDTDRKVNVHLYDGDLERLTAEINIHIDKRKDSIALKRQSENKMKRYSTHNPHCIRQYLTAIH